MKKNLLFFICVLCLSVTGYSQKIKNAIEKGDLAGIEKMAASGLDVYYYFDLLYYDEFNDDFEWEAMYPMAYAVAKSRPDIVDFYIKNKDAMPELEWWGTALPQAFIISLALNDDAMANKLFELGPDLDFLCMSCHDHNAIMVAAVNGQEDWYFKLKKNSELTYTSSDGNTMLHLAAYSDSHRIFDDVLGSGNYDVNQENNFGERPLDYAVQKGNVDFFKHLVESEASVADADMIWFSAARSGNMDMFAMVKQHAETRDLFVTDLALDMPLFIAISENHTDMAVQMVDMMIAYADSMTYDCISNDCIWQNEVHPLYWAIDSANQVTYEALLKLIDKANTAMQSPEFMPVYTELYKPAKKAFGEAFVEEMYKKYNVTQVD